MKNKQLIKDLVNEGLLNEAYEVMKEVSGRPYPEEPYVKPSPEDYSNNEKYDISLDVRDPNWTGGNKGNIHLEITDFVYGLKKKYGIEYDDIQAIINHNLDFLQED